MPAPSKLPSVDEIEALLNLGHTYEEIGKMYDSTRTAVHKKLSRSGKLRRQPTYRDLVPWKVLPEHRTGSVMRRVRSLAAKQLGKRLEPSEERLLDEWLLGMEEAGVILNYHPEAPSNAASANGGFYYSPRRPGEVGLFRAPDSE